MASRTSTLVQPSKGALLYHNDTKKAQLVTIHGVSNSTTDNPQVTLLLNTDASAPVNYEVNQFTVSGSGNIVNLSVTANGMNAFANTQSGYSYLGNTNGVAFATQANGSDYYWRYANIDPWMITKPSEYGNADDNTLQFVGTNDSHYAAAWHNVASGLRDGSIGINSLLSGTDDSSDSQVNVSYKNRGMCYDQHTQSFIGINNNPYMTGGVYRRGSQNWLGPTNSTSGSVIYGLVINGNYDPQNYPASGNYQLSWSPPLSADGGLFVVNYQHYSQNYHRIAFMPVRALYGGTLPTDHTQTDSTVVTGGSNLAISDFLTNATNRVSHIQTASASGDEFQWMKWNKANDKYYVCFKSGSLTAAHSGIWEFGYDATTNSAWSEGNIAGGGPNGQNQYSTSNYGWTKVGEYPASQTTRLTIPAKVGANLWLMYTEDGTAYFSENLYTWTAASSYLESGYVIKNQDASGVDFFQKSDGSVVTTTTGISEMAQSGLLEKSTAIGNYTRNGLVLNPGDCIFTDNLSTTTSVSFTVTEVEI